MGHRNFYASLTEEEETFHSKLYGFEYAVGDEPQVHRHDRVLLHPLFCLSCWLSNIISHLQYPLHICCWHNTLLQQLECLHTCTCWTQKITYKGQPFSHPTHQPCPRPNLEPTAQASKRYYEPNVNYRLVNVYLTITVTEDILSAHHINGSAPHFDQPHIQWPSTSTTVFHRQFKTDYQTVHVEAEITFRSRRF